MALTQTPVTDDQRIGVAWRELRRGASALRLKEILYGADLELGQVDALDLLVQRGQCRMSELADALRVDASTATRAVNRLVKGGLAERVADEADARAVRVQLTPRGVELQAEVADRRKRFFDRTLEGFTDDERRRLADLLERLVAGLDAAVAGADDS
jgi:DNA-binding MarR family transcriptional regulator